MKGEQSNIIFKTYLTDDTRSKDELHLVNINTYKIPLLSLNG